MTMITFDPETQAEITRAAAEARAGNAAYCARIIEAGVTVTLMEYFNGEGANGSNPLKVAEALGYAIGQLLDYWLQEWPPEARRLAGVTFAKAGMDEIGCTVKINDSVTGLAGGEDQRPN